MKTYHTTVTRRDFMKALGLTGAGLTAAATVPSFVDLDDAISQGAVKRPWWARTVETPTTEVDWPNMKKFSEGNTMRGSAAKYMPTYIDQAETERRAALKKEVEDGYKADKKAGYTVRDYAFSGSAGQGAVSNSFMGPMKAKTPQQLGVAPWEGTKEENAAMLRTVLRFFGAMSVGFTELHEDTTMKLMYEKGPGNKQEYIFADVDEPSETATEQIFPRKCRWVVTIVNQESQELWKRNPTPLQVQIRYSRAQNIQEQFQEFMRSLGYLALSEGGNGTGIAPAFGVMSGLGEMGRMNRMITTEYGPTVGIFRYVTDMPLPDEKPIDAGFLRFCKTCMKCADACGEGAISFEKEPYWEVVGGWNNPGHRAWFEDSRKCRAYKMLPDSCNAGKCLSVCTFTKYEKAGVHGLVKAVSSTTPVFNGFFRNMDDIFYHDGLKDPATFWETPVPVYGIDGSIGLNTQ
ncbi:reductive dehalogenase [Dehalogenimonas sp. THU2]|uniref:reductive dehalogenase n=1 Tax=Dehalogenimonas sp. THU2 TaxID=3151121 RepID=UPI003218B1F6